MNANDNTVPHIRPHCRSSTVYIAKCKYTRGKVVLKAYELSNMSGGAQKILKTRLGIMQEIMAPDRYQSRYQA